MASSKPVSKLKTCKSPRDFHNWLYMVQAEIEDNYPEIAEVFRCIADEPKEAVVRGKCMIDTSHINPAEEMQVLKMVKKAVPEEIKQKGSRYKIAAEKTATGFCMKLSYALANPEWELLSLKIMAVTHEVTPIDKYKPYLFAQKYEEWLKKCRANYVV